MKPSRTKFEQFLNIELAGGGSFYGNENAIVFVYDSPGTLQIFKQSLGDQHCKWPQRLTFHEDRCTDPRVLPDDTIVFCKDKGGNENYQIHAIFPSGDEAVLSSDENAKHMLGFVGRSHFYFSANLEDKTRFDVYRFSVPIKEDCEFKLVHKTQPGIIVIPRAESPSAKKIATLYAKSNMDSDIYLYDFETKTLKNASQEIKNKRTARFTPWEFLDDEKLIVTSDLNREFMCLAILDTTSNQLIWLEEDLWDTVNVLYHRETDQLVYTKNEDGITKLYLMRDFSKSQELNPHELPLPGIGNILAGDYRSWTKAIQFSKNGKHLLFSFSSGKLNPNLWMLYIEKSELKR